MKSQLYRQVLKLPTGVSIEKNENLLKFSGLLGHAYLHLGLVDPTGIGSIDIRTNLLEISSPSRCFFGLLRKLVKNKITGVSQGFLVYLRIQGVGYRARIQDDTLYLRLGYSHDILYKIPRGVLVFCINPTTLCIFGIDRNQITQIAALVCHLRKPSPYKGKGIRILHQHVRIKQGKKK